MKKVKKVSPRTDVSKEFRHLGVMIESVGDDVKLVAEQYGDIKKTLDTHTEMIGHLAVDVEIVKDDISTLKKDMAITKEDIEFIKNNLKKKVDIDEFSALERRVSLLEKHSVKR